MKRLSKEEKLFNDFKDYNTRIRKCGLKEKTLEEYKAYRKGRSRLTIKGARSPLETTTQVRQSPKVASGAGIGTAIPKKKELAYTGENLLGIATMHKSNMVPVFKQSDAEEISKMRRN